MNQDIVLDITPVVNQQKESKGKRFRIAVLVVGVLILAALVFAAVMKPIFLVAIGVAALLVALVGVFTYSIPSRKEQKFLTPYIADITEELRSRGYKFADTKAKANLRPWFSSQSAYLYGSGLVINKSMAKGLKMRQIKFDHSTGLAPLSVERIMTKQQTLIRVITLDGKPLAPVLNPSAPVLKVFPPVKVDPAILKNAEIINDPSKAAIIYKTDDEWDTNSLT